LTRYFGGGRDEDLSQEGVLDLVPEPFVMTAVHEHGSGWGEKRFNFRRSVDKKRRSCRKSRKTWVLPLKWKAIGVPSRRGEGRVPDLWRGKKAVAAGLQGEGGEGKLAKKGRKLAFAKTRSTAEKHREEKCRDRNKLPRNSNLA